MTMSTKFTNRSVTCVLSGPCDTKALCSFWLENHPAQHRLEPNQFEIYKIFITQVDSSYQFCKWTNPHQQECDFGWNRAQWNITTQECHDAFSEKVVVIIIIIIINIKIIATDIAIGNVTLTTLNESAILIIIQAVFHGNYGDHECGITIDSATYQDEGTWR